jgi:CubicO group peptidase (beta-lactamase class C family)
MKSKIASLLVVSRASARRFSRPFGAISRSLFRLVASALFMLGMLVPQSALHAAPQQQHLLFDGIDDEVTVPHGADFQFSSAVTFEAWIRPSSISATTAQDRVVSKSNALELTVSTGDTGCSFSTKGHVQWRATIAGLDRRICGGTLTVGQWHHVAGTYAAGSFRLYVNGVQVAGVTRSGVLNPGTSPFKIGNHLSLARNFDGGIDEVRIWNRALTQAEIQSNKDSELTGTEAGLVAYYNMNEGAGQILRDLTGRGHDGTLGSSSGTDSKDPVWTVSSEVDAQALANALAYGQSKGTGSIRVVLNGTKVGETGSQTTRYQLRSATKSVGALILGIAVGEGRVALSDLAISRLPAFANSPTDSNTQDRKKRVTLEHLATHLAGFEKPGGEGAIIFEPGSGFFYSDGGANWLADVLTYVYHQDLAALFGNRTGINVAWRSNAYRTTTLDGVARREFGSGISASVTEMAQVGQLALTGGGAISASYLAQMRQTRPILSGKPVHPGGTSTPNAPRHYGLLWWNNNDSSISGVPTDAFWAWGLGEAIILVIPSLRLVVTRAGNNWQSDWSADYNVVAEFFRRVVAAVNP